MSLLGLEGLRKDYGGLTAVRDVSLVVQPGERRALIGPNGAGKTTLFKLITGEAAPTKGKVLFDGRDITRLPVYARANLGLAQTFQRNNLFLNLSVLDNVRLAVQHRHGVAAHPLRPAAHYAAVIGEAEALLRQLGLHDQQRQRAATLAYGQQRALEVALALATQPRLLLLDEPTAGMSPAETAEMIRYIAALPRSLTVLIVEHDMDVVFRLADRLTVLHNGEVIAEGAVGEVRANPQVQAIYLGQPG
jgi:branched-chain amino acid transport system ATP-binding protein